MTALGDPEFSTCWSQLPMAATTPRTDHRNHLTRADGVGGGAGHDLASSPTELIEAA